MENKRFNKTINDLLVNNQIDQLHRSGSMGNPVHISEIIPEVLEKLLKPSEKEEKVNGEEIYRY